MITKQQYLEYLICTIGNFTSTNLADHLDDVMADIITDNLSGEHLTARGLWELVTRLIQDSPEAFMLVDDSVQDKGYSRFIELVKLHYSGAEHGLVRGIGVVNLVHSAGAEKDFYPIDYRIYAPDQDGKTKNDIYLLSWKKRFVPLLFLRNKSSYPDDRHVGQSESFFSQAICEIRGEKPFIGRSINSPAESQNSLPGSWM